MRDPTALVIVIAADGTRSQQTFHTGLRQPGGWFNDAMRCIGSTHDRTQAFRGMVVIDPDGDVLNYNAAEVAELTGLGA